MAIGQSSYTDKGKTDIYNTVILDRPDERYGLQTMQDKPTYYFWKEMVMVILLNSLKFFTS